MLRLRLPNVDDKEIATFDRTMATDTRLPNLGTVFALVHSQ
jgi:hypothetical protein